MVANVLFCGYHLVLLKKAPYNHVMYTWNMVDLVNIGLFFAYVWNRAEILYVYSRDNNLQPHLAGLPHIYMPYVHLSQPFYRAQAVLAWLGLFSWIRLLKYLSLVKTFRVLIRTLEQCCFQLFIYSFIYISVTVGFSIAFVVGFGAADTTDGLYSTFEGCFFMLFFMLVGGVDLKPILGRESVSFMSNWVLRYMLFMAYMVLIVLLCFNFFMAIVVDTYSRTCIQMLGESRKNPCMVFLYTYYHKWRGVQLVKEDEEDIGGPDEQYIEVAVLPGFVGEVWKTKQVALIDMIQEAEARAESERKEGAGVVSRRFSSKNIPGFSRFGSKQAPKMGLPMMNANLISRLQLQRLLDDSPEIQEVLKSKRAIDVIRRFRADRGPDPYTEITRMQESVILKLDTLEKIGLNLEFAEVESLKMVSNGLNDALTEVQNQWRTELTSLLESCSSISNFLIDLTDRLAACTEKHQEIARDIDITEVP